MTRVVPTTIEAGHPDKPPAKRSIPAFTLIELLVGISIIGVLMAVLLPALKGARDTARTVTDLSAGQQLMTAFHLYADDHRGVLLPGYATDAMVSDNPPPDQQPLIVLDETGERVYGVPARRYPWRIAPYLEYNFSGLYKDKNVLQRYRERADFQYVISLSPSYGLNSVFIGGDSDRMGFTPAFLRGWGSFYITRLDQPRRPDSLLVFASAHGVNPDGGELVPGYFRADAPARTGRAWLTSGPAANPGTLPGSYGNVDFRNRGKAACSMFDGHGSTAGFDDLDDMRKWSDQATRRDWTLGSNP